MVGLDILPFTIATPGKRDAKLRGLNLIGLKRRGFSDEAINSLKKAYKTLFMADLKLPDAAFYLWAGLPAAAGADDIAWARGLLAQYNVAVLPGSLLARVAHGVNPGAGRIRLALVAEVEECLEAARRIVEFTARLLHTDLINLSSTQTR